jgi:hypothetical protein
VNGHIISLLCNSVELHRVLVGHLKGEPVDTGGFEERERPFLAMPDADLWTACVDGCERLR